MTPNSDTILDHLHTLFRRVPNELPGARYEIRCLHPTENKNESRTFDAAEEMHEGVEFAEEQNAQGMNVYVGVNPRHASTPPLGACDAADVAGAFFNFCDLDDEESVTALKEMNGGTPIYNFSVITGLQPHVRGHAYWELSSVARNMKAWSETQAGIADRLGGDRVIDPPRIMRLAGTVSYPSNKKATKGYQPEVVKINKNAEERTASNVMHSAFPIAQRANDNVASGIFNDDGMSAGVDIDTAMREIRSGTNLHNNARDIAAHLVSKGRSSWEIQGVLEGLLRGVSDGGTLEQVPQLIRSARVAFNEPEPDQKHQSQARAIGAIAASAFGSITAEDIAPRQWLYGTHLIKKYVSASISPGGVGKTTLALMDAISIATGESVTSDKVYEQGNVWHYNLEDPLDELQRRVVAICQHFDIPLSKVASTLFINSGRDRPLVVAERLPEGTGIVAMPDVDGIIAAIRENKIVAMSIDPFVKCHYADENNNKEIDAVLSIWAQIAHDTGCAIDLIHHVRKPPSGITASVAGDINQARGASALSGAVRSARTLTVMTVLEAEKIGIDGDDRGWYVRVDDAKGNMSAPVGKATWLTRKSVSIGNGGPFDEGDSVGILDQWSPPDPFDGITMSEINRILDAIRDGVETDVRYKKSPKAEHYVGNVINEVTSQGRSDNEVKAIIKTWFASGVLFLEDYKDRVQRREVKGVYVDGSKRPGSVSE